MRAPTPTPTRTRAALLAGGLALLVAGVALVAWVLASSAGLVGADDDPTMAAPATTASAPADAPRTVDYRLEPGDGDPVTVRLEVAADPAARARGLMEREQVPPGTGMVFLYPADVAEAFWMKNTLVPLSIAFVAADGRVVAVREMVPCTADPCPVYRPGRPCRYAVELAAGSFGAAGVGPGDRVVPVDPAALPEPA